MNKTKNNNKHLLLKTNNAGFSLVELIIVIAIMAILAAALAPQLMKYIEKSRENSDKNACASIKNTVNAVISDGATDSNIGNPPIGDIKVATASDFKSGTDDKFEKELAKRLSDLKAPKAKDMTKWKISIASNGDDGYTVEVTTTGDSTPTTGDSTP